MKTAFFLSITIVLLLESSCMMLKQTEVLSRSSDISGTYYDGCVDLHIDQRYWPEKYEINQDSSYVIGPKEKK